MNYSEFVAAIKRLHDKTGLPHLSCRRALLEANHDEVKAIEILRKKTFESMKRSGGVLDG